MNLFTVGIASGLRQPFESGYSRDIPHLFGVVVMLALGVGACEASQPAIPNQYASGQGGIATTPGDAAQTTPATGGIDAAGASGLPTAGTVAEGTGGVEASLDASASPPAQDASSPEIGTTFDASESGDGAAVVATGGSGGSTPVDTGTPPPPSGDAAEVCARWKADSANQNEGTWSGDVASCDPGDISTEGRENALRMLNLFRWLADLPAIQTDPTFNQKAQACALMMRANNTLSHNPPQSWTCWSAEGADGASKCNISSGPGVSSVKGYMIDPGNPTTIGHRRWILSNSIGPTGLGSTDRHSCMWTMGTSRAGKAWVAWPPAGVMPFQAMGSLWSNTDSTGWTVQSDSINLGGAQVTVTSDGETLPVTVTQLLPGYGSRYAIRFNPQGWQSQAGKIYSVSVSGIAQPIEYQVEMADCI